MRALRHDLDLSNMSKGFRRDCLRLNVARRACTPRRALDGKTPFEVVWPGQQPPYKYFKVFGSACTLLRHAKTVQDKTIPRGEPAIYIGTAAGEREKHSGFLLWVPRLRKRIIAEHVEFNEHRLPARREPNVVDFATALPGYITAQEYLGDLCDDLPAYEDTVPTEHVTDLDDSHEPDADDDIIACEEAAPEANDDAEPEAAPVQLPLTPLAQRLFDRLHDEPIYEGHTLLTPRRLDSGRQLENEAARQLALRSIRTSLIVKQTVRKSWILPCESASSPPTGNSSILPCGHDLILPTASASSDAMFTTPAKNTGTRMCASQNTSLAPRTTA